MATLNKVFLIGNLTRDPELKYITSGVGVTKFGLAVNRTYNSQDGEKKNDTCFVDITAWDKLAEVCAEHLSKGRLVLVEGRLQYQSWKDDDGTKRSKLEVVAQNVQFLGNKQEGDETGEKTDDSDVPF
jgi:single-strand DNA-binding protein